MSLMTFLKIMPTSSFCRIVSTPSFSAINRQPYSGKTQSVYRPTSIQSRPSRLRSFTMTRLTRLSRTSSIRRLNAGLSKLVPVQPSSTQQPMICHPWLSQNRVNISFWFSMLMDSPCRSSSRLSRAQMPARYVCRAVMAFLPPRCTW